MPLSRCHALPADSAKHVVGITDRNRLEIGSATSARHALSGFVVQTLRHELGERLAVPPKPRDDRRAQNNEWGSDSRRE